MVANAEQFQRTTNALTVREI